MTVNDNYFYAPQGGHGLPHDPFKAIIAPRVIGWISTVSRDGTPNLAPYSFFGAFASNPPVIGFSSEGFKDSVRNIEETGEFVWNFATKTLRKHMNISSSPVARNVDEFLLAGLTASAGRNVNVPHVAESPASMECKVLSIQRLKTLDGQDIDNWLTLGQVVGVRIQSQFLKDGLFDTAAAEPILRAGYLGDYAELGEMFEMFRPQS